MSSTSIYVVLLLLKSCNENDFRTLFDTKTGALLLTGIDRNMCCGTHVHNLSQVQVNVASLLTGAANRTCTQILVNVFRLVIQYM